MRAGHPNRAAHAAVQRDHDVQGACATLALRSGSVFLVHTSVLGTTGVSQSPSVAHTQVAKLQRACLRDPVKVEVAAKYSTVETLRQQYMFVPAKHKVRTAHCVAYCGVVRGVVRCGG